MCAKWKSLICTFILRYAIELSYVHTDVRRGIEGLRVLRRRVMGIHQCMGDLEGCKEISIRVRRVIRPLSGGVGIGTAVMQADDLEEYGGMLESLWRCEWPEWSYSM